MSASYQDSLQSMLNRLAPMQIGKYNQLQEWLEDFVWFFVMEMIEKEYVKNMVKYFYCKINREYK